MEKLESLINQHKEAIQKASDLSKEIVSELRLIYNSEKIKEFKSFDEFLEDINYLCETHSIGKLLFIKEIEEAYFKK